MFSLLLVTSLLGQFPLSTQVELPTGEKAFLGADFLRYDPARQLLQTEGNVTLKTAQVLVRADEIEWDQGKNRAVARGKVMFVSGMIAAVADEVIVDVNSEEATLKGALFMQKQNVAPEVLLQARTPQELKQAGSTALSISAAKFKRIGKNEFAVEGLSFTPCDCKPGEPSWRVEATRAEVEIGEKATLTFPRVYIAKFAIPIFALPWLYLPLAERRTGILIPDIRTGGLNGWQVSQPVFVTLGRSYDVTLTPGYYFGAGDERLVVPPGQPEILDPSGGAVFRVPVYGIQGPRLQTEFRYVPSGQTAGRLSLGLLHDLRPVRDPVYPDMPPGFVRDDPATPENEYDQYFALAGDPLRRHELEALKRGLPRRGLRGELSWQHTQQLSSQWHARADASLVSDGFLNRDVTADLIAAQDQYLRSTATVFRRTHDSYLGADLVLRQDLRWGYSAFGLDRDPTGEKIRGPSTIQRLPGLRFALPQRHLAGPVYGGGHVELVRLSPLWSQTGDEGIDGRFRPERGAVDIGQADGRYTRSFVDEATGELRLSREREARIRLSLRPEFSSEFSFGEWARVSPYAGYRQDLFYGEATSSLAHRGYPLAGVYAATELSKTFGKQQDLRHAIVPSLELRYVPFVVSGGAAPYATAPYDEVDLAIDRERAAAGKGLLQGNVEVSQRLLLRQGTTAREALRVDFGQNFDLAAGRPGDSYARMTAEVPNLTVTCSARYDLSRPQDGFSQIFAHARVDNGKGTWMFAEYNNLLQGGSDRLRRGTDELVGAPYVPQFPNNDPTQPELPRSRAELINTGVRVQTTFGLGLRYQTQIGRIGDPQAPPEDPLRTKYELFHHELGLSYGPACDCWRLEVRAVLRPGRLDPEFGASLTLARFGTFGT